MLSLHCPKFQPARRKVQVGHYAYSKCLKPLVLANHITAAPQTVDCRSVNKSEHEARSSQLNSKRLKIRGDFVRESDTKSVRVEMLYLEEPKREKGIFSASVIDDFLQKTRKVLLSPPLIRTKLAESSQIGESAKSSMGKLIDFDDDYFLFSVFDLSCR